MTLFDQTGGNSVLATAKHYAKDIRHLVLLNGFSLQESTNGSSAANSPKKQPFIWQGILEWQDKTLDPFLVKQIRMGSCQFSTTISDGDTELYKSVHHNY